MSCCRHSQRGEDTCAPCPARSPCPPLRSPDPAALEWLERQKTTTLVKRLLLSPREAEEATGNTGAHTDGRRAKAVLAKSGAFASRQKLQESRTYPERVRKEEITGFW